MLSAGLKTLKALCTFNIWEVELFSLQRNPPHLQGAIEKHWLPGQWRRLNAENERAHTHTETHRSTHTDTHTLGSKDHSTGGKSNPLKRKLSVVLSTAHSFRARPGKHRLLTVVKLFLDVCPYSTRKHSHDYRRDWKVSNLEWNNTKYLGSDGYFSGKHHIPVGKLSTENGSEKASF